MKGPRNFDHSLPFPCRAHPRAGIFYNRAGPSYGFRARIWPFVEIRKTENPFLRREVAGCRQARPGWLTTTPRSGPAGPEPKLLSKFIFGPEPDTAPYDFFLHTIHRFKTNRFFEYL